MDENLELEYQEFLKKLDAKKAKEAKATQAVNEPQSEIGRDSKVTSGQNQNNGGSQKTKRLIAGLAVILLISVSGTFAMLQVYQAAFNPDMVDVIVGARVHDVFEGGRIGTGDSAQDMFGPRNKNVFVENYGNVHVGVRVQFHEFVSIGGTPLENETGTEMALDDVSTWNTVRFVPNPNLTAPNNMIRQGDVTVEGTSAYIGNRGIEWQLGHFTGESQKWYMPTFNRVHRRVESNALIIGREDSVFNTVNAYLFTDTSGRAIDAIAGGCASTLGGVSNEHDYVVDILDWQDDFTLANRGHYVSGANENFRGQTGRPQHPGLFNYWNPVEGEPRTETGDLWFINFDTPAQGGVLYVYEEYEMTARQTLPAATVRVMTMSQWIAADMPDGNFWVHDEDSPEGWFYWVGENYGMIDPETATSLLLRQTILPALPQLEYVIRVNAQLFREDTLPPVGTAYPRTQMTQNARYIFERPVDSDTDTDADNGNGYDNGYENGGEGEPIGMIFIKSKRFNV